MARLILEDLTKEQAQELAHWFENQGEQDCATWFEIKEIPSPYVNVRAPECIREEGEDVIVKCYTPGS